MSRIPRNAIIGAALVMGIAAAFLAYSYMAKPSRGNAAAVQIVTARGNISTGAILTADVLQMKSISAADVPADAVNELRIAVGKVAIRDIKAAEPITAENISGKSRLSHMIPKFMRAVTVAIDPIIGVGGYLEPGDRVDVVATFNSNDGTLTKIVLQDAQLIAIGSEVVEDNQASSDEGVKAAPKTQTNATLAIMPSEAEKLILAESKGKLRLVLRRSDDNTYTETKGINSRTLFGIIPSDVPNRVVDLAPPPRPAPVKPVRSPLVPQLPPFGVQRFEIKPRPPVEALILPKKTIEIIRGTKVEQTTVDK